MTQATNPTFVLLNQMIDAMVDNLNENSKTNIILDDFDVDPSVKVKTPEASFIDIYGSLSSPIVYVGDRLQYKSGAIDMENGRIKMKKYTLEYKMSEDTWRLFKQENDSRNPIVAAIANYRKKANETMIQRIAKSTISGALDSDPNYQKPLGAGPASSPKIDNPYDLNATPGTPAALEALNFTGTAKTIKAMERLLADVDLGMYKEDINTNIQMIPEGTPLKCGMHPRVFKIFKNNRQKENGTSEQENALTYLKQMEAQGITSISSSHFGSYTYASTNTTVITFYAPMVSGIRTLKLKLAKSVSQEVWTPWEKYRDQSGDVSKFVWITTKDVVVGTHVLPFLVNVGTASKSSFIYYKPLYRATITPYENT